MSRRWTNDLTAQDVTPERVFLNRRQLMSGVGALGIAGGLAAPAMRKSWSPTVSRILQTTAIFTSSAPAKVIRRNMPRR